jgi:hypothetical protein
MTRTAPLRTLLLVFGLAAYGAIVIYADPFQLGLYLFCAFWPVALACVAAVIVFIYALATRRPLYPPRLLLTVAFGLAGLLALSVPLNSAAQQYAVAVAKAYPDRVAVLLEDYRRQHGSYPASLDQLPSHPRVPRLMRTPFGYQSDGHRYDFSFPSPGGLIDVWNYDSETHVWVLST